MKKLLNRFIIALLAAAILPLAAMPVFADDVLKFTDDCTTLDNIYEMQGIDGVNSSIHGRSVYGMLKTTRSGYAVYKMQGNIKSFEVFGVIAGAGAYNQLEYDIYVSADNVDYKKINAPLIWGNQFGEVTTLPSGGYPVKYMSNTIPDGMKYLKIVLPSIKDGIAQADGDYWRSVYKVNISYLPAGAEASTKGEIAAADNVTVDFSEAMDASTVDASQFTLEDGPQTVSAELSEDGLSCVVTFAESLKAGTSYKLILGDGLKSAEGNPVTAGRELNIQTFNADGSINFTDDCTTLDKIYKQNGSLALSNSFYDEPVYGNSAGEKAISVEYKFDGEIKQYKYEMIIHGSTVYEKGLDFFVYLSPDGKNYTPMVKDEDYKESSSRLDTVTTYALHVSYASVDDKIPSGMKYLKIEFPTLKDGETDVNYQRSIASVKVKYAIGAAGIYSPECKMAVNDDGSITQYLEFGTVNEIAGNAINPEDITIADENISCTEVVYTNGKYCAYFDTVFDFGSEHTAVISENVRDIYGYPINAESREIKFKAPEKPNAFEYKSMSYTLGGRKITAIAPGRINCTAEISGIYFDGAASKNIAVVTVLYSGDRVEEVKLASVTVAVGKAKKITNTVNASEDSTRAETFVFDSIETSVPLLESVCLSEE